MNVPFPDNSADPLGVRDQRRYIASISQHARNIKTRAYSHCENEAAALLTELLFRAAVLRASRNIRTDMTQSDTTLRRALTVQSIL
jgi:hypothetical protein